VRGTADVKALHGIRVVDLGIVTAGASTSAILADLGADVIKVEGPDYVDPFRRWAGMVDDEGWWDRSPYYRFTNRNKRSLCVDLKTETGRRLLLDLVAISDIVVENFRVGVLERLGLGFAALAEVNPRIVLASISSQGSGGPDARAVSFGSTLEASSGMASLMTYADGAPQVSGQALNYPDQVVSLLASGMIVAALVDARAGARATHLDISQREIAAFLVGERIMAGARRSRGGGSSAIDSRCDGVIDAAREGLYRSRDGRWVAVTLRNRDDAAECAEGIGDDGDHLAAWVAARDAVDAVAELRARSHCAETVRTVRDMLDAAGARHPGSAIADDATGFPVKGLPWSIDGEPPIHYAPAHALGADNRDIVVDLLHRDDATYRELVSAGVLADRPRHMKRD
jgi:crotonobetainyl-CoA:carnitine CoA-transferase CaiB-like acyl-CoA transferase